MKNATYSRRRDGKTGTGCVAVGPNVGVLKTAAEEDALQQPWTHVHSHKTHHRSFNAVQAGPARWDTGLASRTGLPMKHLGKREIGGRKQADAALDCVQDSADSETHGQGCPCHHGAASQSQSKPVKPKKTPSDAGRRDACPTLFAGPGARPFPAVEVPHTKSHINTQ